MLALKRIAVTGTISSGKSTVCHYFGCLGAYVVSADALLHKVLYISHPIGRSVVRIFGESVVQGQRLDRARIAERIVLEPKLLTELEDICHPFVNQAIQQQFQNACRENERHVTETSEIDTDSQKHFQAHVYSVFVAEVPLLFESRYPLWPWFDSVVAVVADRSIAQDRYVRAHGGTADAQQQFAFRDQRQVSAAEKEQRAEYVITNNGNFEDLKAQVQVVFDAICTD